MCQCNPVIRLNTEGLRLNKILKILFAIYILIIVAKLILRDYNGAMSGLIVMLFLMVSFLMCHYLFAGYLIFFILFNMFYVLVFLALRVQNKVADVPEINYKKGLFEAVIVLEVFSFFFYIFLIFYSFKAYKEFKALYANGGDELSSADVEGNGQGGQSRPGYSPFSGSGVAVG